MGGEEREKNVLIQVLLWPWDPQPLTSESGGGVSTGHFADVSSSNQVLFGPDICRVCQNTEVRMLTDALWRCRELLGQTHLSDTPGMQEISPGPSLGCWEDSVSSCLLMGP